MSHNDKKSLVGDIEVILVSANPMVTAVDALGGTVMLWDGDEGTGRPTLWYIKLSDGSNTNAQPFISLNKYNASAAPTVSDDETDGYFIGSKWYWDDSGTPKIYECFDASTGAAKWVQLG